MVVFNDNTLKTGIPLEHIQGQLENVSGWSNGLGVKVEGIMRLESVVLMGQQITGIESPFRVQDGCRGAGGHARALPGRRPLGPGAGSAWMPRRAITRWMTLHGAQLEEYARTLGGRQPYRGNIEARLECSGLGSDLRTLQGHGEAHITQGDLGKLPFFFRIAGLLNPTRTLSDAPRVQVKTAFDSADVTFTIAHGLSTLDPIKFTGNAFSLLGRARSIPRPIWTSGSRYSWAGTASTSRSQRSRPRGRRTDPQRPRHGHSGQSQLQAGGAAAAQRR